MITFKEIEAEKDVASNTKKIKYFFEGVSDFVEEFALNFYKKEGYKGIISANDYWWTLTALLFWDVIYAKLEGVYSKHDGDFPNEKQDMPYDLFSSEFYEKRKPLIDNRIKSLEISDLSLKIKSSYNQNFGKPCRFIENWNRFNEIDLIEPIKFIESKIVIQILERILKNFCENRSGMPDIIIYKHNNFRFVEVKSERDKISNNQNIWAEFLSKILNQNFEYFLVNQSAKKLESTKGKTYQDIFISFGKSTSQKRQEAIKFISLQPTYLVEGEGVNAIHMAKFNTQEIESLFKILDLTSGVKTRVIKIGDKLISSSELRHSLGCFKKKEEEKASSDYCKYNEFSNNRNKFDCNMIDEDCFTEDRWSKYGFIDSDTGKWIFDKKEINKKINQIIEELSLCPLFNPNKLQNFINNLPNEVHPKNDIKWAYISEIDHISSIWCWKNGRWVSDFSETEFPGYASMTGVKLLNKNDLELINLSLNNFQLNYAVKLDKKNRKDDARNATAKQSELLWIIIILIIIWLAI
jgi:hypothetical protein